MSMTLTSLYSIRRLSLTTAAPVIATGSELVGTKRDTAAATQLLNKAMRHNAKAGH